MGILAAVIAVGVILIIFTMMRMLLGSTKQSDPSILRDGEVAVSARILDIVDTGSRFNNNPLVRLKVEVSPPIGLPFQTEVKTIVSIVDLPAFQPGSVVRAKYNPGKTSSLVIIGK